MQTGPDHRRALAVPPVDEFQEALDQLFGVGVRSLRMEEAVFEAMLEGWERQQRSRMLRDTTIRSALALVRRVCESTEAWPWQADAIPASV